MIKKAFIDKTMFASGSIETEKITSIIEDSKKARGASVECILEAVKEACEKRGRPFEDITHIAARIERIPRAKGNKVCFISRMSATEEIFKERDSHFPPPEVPENMIYIPSKMLAIIVYDGHEIVEIPSAEAFRTSENHYLGPV